METSQEHPPANAVKIDTLPDIHTGSTKVEPTPQLKVVTEEQIAPVEGSETQPTAAALKPAVGIAAVSTYAPAKERRFRKKMNIAATDASDKDACEDLEVLLEQVRQRHRAIIQIGHRAFEEAVSLGGLLNSAKKRLAHGEWYPFLQEAKIEARSAQHYMLLHKRYPELLTKCENISELTIVTGIKALRSPKPKPNVTPTTNEADEVATAPSPEKVAAEEDEGMLNSGPPAISLDGDEQRKKQESSDEVTSLAAQDQSATSKEGSGREQEPKKDEAEGFLSVEGTRWSPDLADDGLILRTWTQGQIKQLKDNNDRAPEERKRSVGELRLTEVFIVELARAVNRVTGTLGAQSEGVMIALDEAVHLVRNFIHPEVVAMDERQRLSALGARQNDCA